MDERYTHEYDDIIHLPHHQSATRPHMPVHDRAAQFAPFAALTGFDETIQEVERLTEGRLVLSEDEEALLNERLMLLNERIAERPAVSAVYFVPDGRKAGGAYVRCTGEVRRIDEHRRLLIFADGRELPIDDLHALDGAVFRAEEGEQT